MIKCIIVDDEELAQNVLEKYINSIPWLELVKKCDNAIETLSFLRKNCIDIMFLDIKMPELSGLQMLNALETQPKVILTTAYSEYALDSYDYAVIDYLLKPIEFDRFLIAVNKAAKQIEMEKKSSKKDEKQPLDSLFIYQDQTTFRIPFDHIFYIKAEGNYISIKSDSKNYITRESMHDIEDKLDKDIFARVHKSYIVSLKKIKKIYGNRVIIDNEKIPIGNFYKLKFLEKLKNINY